MNVFPYFKQVALDSGSADNVDLNSDPIKAILLEGLTYDATDHYLSDVLADAGVTEIARSGALAGVTLTINGNVVNFDHTDETVPAVPTGHTVTDVVYYKDTGVDGSSVVIAHVDEDNAAQPLSLPTNGSDVLIQAPNGVFDL